MTEDLLFEAADFVETVFFTSSTLRPTSPFYLCSLPHQSWCTQYWKKVFGYLKDKYGFLCCWYHLKSYLTNEDFNNLEIQITQKYTNLISYK